MAIAEPRQIEWNTAEVEDEALKVKLSGPSSKHWSKRFNGVLALLSASHGEWGEIRLTKKGIKVGELHQGSEMDLRHFLESIVLQANSDLQPQTPEQSPDSESDDPTREAEQQMAATFKTFANETS
jgi:hypothetical protein